MTTLCITDYAPSAIVTPINSTPEGLARGVKFAAYRAAKRHGLPTGTCLEIRDRAVRRYRAGRTSAAMALTQAEAEARQAARAQTGGDAA